MVAKRNNMQATNRESFIVEYSIDDLRNLIQFPLLFKPVNFYKGLPIHLVEDEEIVGELFKTGDIYFKNEKITGIKIEASNYGRIRIDRRIRIQSSRNEEDYDYLHIPNMELPDVHRIISFIWHTKPVGVNYDELIVHHISNNGYDNRPCNLLWVTSSEHKLIHDTPIFAKKLDFATYKYI